LKVHAQHTKPPDRAKVQPQTKSWLRLCNSISLTIYVLQHGKTELLQRLALCTD